MTLIRFLTYLTGITAVSGLVFGWATPMFAVGEVCAALWLILYMLLKWCQDDQPHTVDQLSIDEIQAMRAEGWRHCYGDGGPYMRWDGADVADELPYKPVWPREIGAPE